VNRTVGVVWSTNSESLASVVTVAQDDTKSHTCLGESFHGLEGTSSRPLPASYGTAIESTSKIFVGQSRGIDEKERVISNGNFLLEGTEGTGVALDGKWGKFIEALET
jgi:hypothetical protein